MSERVVLSSDNMSIVGDTHHTQPQAQGHFPWNAPVSSCGTPYAQNEYGAYTRLEGTWLWQMHCPCSLSNPTGT
jgi:hypothetical protein